MSNIKSDASISKQNINYEGIKSDLLNLWGGSAN